MWNPRRTNTSRAKPEQGYSWLFFSVTPSGVSSCLLTLLVIGISGTFYLWYRSNGDELTPSGNVGLSYALIGLACLILTAVLYSVRRRLSKPVLGRLHQALNWHACFALIGLSLLYMHSFAAFGPSSGTFALLSTAVLCFSGLLGRALDRVLAWRIAVSESTTLTPDGKDRVQATIQEMKAPTVSQARRANRFAPYSSTSQPHLTSAVQEKKYWDQSYRSLERTPREAKHLGHMPRFMRDNEPHAARPGIMMPSVQMQIAVLREIQQAQQRKQFYHAVIHTWRQVHIALAFLTLGLVIWHVISEMPSLFHTLFH